ncbi:hypothetical protein [Mycoplasma sp. P36-A1]|uniref:hypothetical protein n=1 Tax=Mycoplasma sp. P36-A1 TaxID=3252900 RepID=UPI003C2E5C34
MKKIILALLMTILITGCCDDNVKLEEINLNQLNESTTLLSNIETKELTNICQSYEHAENRNLYDSKYFIKQNTNRIEVYAIINNNCKIIRVIKTKEKLQQIREYEDYSLFSTSNHLYKISESGIIEFGKYNLVSDFEVVDNTIIFSSDYNEEKRTNTLVYIDNNNKETVMVMETNESKLQSITLTEKNVVISYTSDFLGRNIASFYGLGQPGILNNIKRSTSTFDLGKSYNTNREKKDTFKNIYKYAYHVDSQLQCDDEITKCYYFDIEPITFNNYYSVNEINNKTYIIDKKNKLYSELPLNDNDKVELDGNQIIVINSKSITTYNME